MALTHEQLLEMQDKAYNNGYNTRLKAADDMMFAWVSQWDDDYLGSSDLGYRGEFNILRKAMRQITTDLISNPIQVDFDPVDGTDESGADLMDGMYRADMRNNASQEAKKNASQETITCGVGAWELRAEYKTNRAGDERQVIRRYPLYEANNNVFWDPNAKLLDKSDAKFVSCLVAYSEDGYKDLCEELGADDCGDSSFAMPEHSYTFPWIDEVKKIYVSRFFHSVKRKITYLTYANAFGEEVTFPKSELSEREEDLFDDGSQLVGEKDITRYEVTKYIASGEGILNNGGKGEVIAGEYIPVVPQYGERQFVEGEEHYEGIVRLAKDPQRLRNFQLSYLADIVSRSPREKPIFTQEQIGGFEDMYELSGADNNLPYTLQNALDPNGNPLPVGPVGYIKAPEVPAALGMAIGESRAAVDDVAGAGLPADITDVDLSGKALSALNKRLDMQSYTYQDNHKFAMRRDGEIYASMVVEIKDTEEELTLVKLDGSKSTETINKQELEFNETSGVSKVVKNDLTNMVFDVYADVGPSFESVKSENKEELKELLNSGSLDQETHTILLNEYLGMIDGTAFKDLRDYSRKKLIMMGVKQPETDEEKAEFEQAQQAQQEQQDPAMVMAQAEMLKGQADLLEQQNRQQEMSISSAKVQGEAMSRQDKLNSEVQLNVAKVTQEQQKIDDAALNNKVKNAIEMAKLEATSGQDMNAAVADNMLVFDPATGVLS